MAQIPDYASQLDADIPSIEAIVPKKVDVNMKVPAPDKDDPIKSQDTKSEAELPLEQGIKDSNHPTLRPNLCC